MADKQKKEPKSKGPVRVNEDQRMHYIGFEVFPGKPRDLFKNEAEQKQMVERVRERLAGSREVRDECTLMEARVSASDRIIMAIASLVMLGSLLFPWFAAYNEIEENVQAAVRPAETPVAMADSMAAELGDSAALALAEGDSAAMLAAETDSAVMAAVEETSGSDPEAVAAGEGEAAEGAAEDAEEGGGQEVASAAGEGASEEVIHGYVAKKKIYKEYSRLSGLGSLAAIGSVGSYVFGSGGILVITGVLFLLMILATLGLPIYTLYGLFGLKGDSDQKALKLKKILPLNWLPLVLFVLGLALSFVGAEYGFDAVALFDSLGSGYSVAAFMNSLSWGAFIAIAASVLLAVKGIEI